MEQQILNAQVDNHLILMVFVHAQEVKHSSMEIVKEVNLAKMDKSVMQMEIVLILEEVVHKVKDVLSHKRTMQAMQEESKIVQP